MHHKIQNETISINVPLRLSPSSASVTDRLIVKRFPEIRIKSVIQNENVTSKHTIHDLCIFEDGFPPNGREIWLRR